MDVLWRFTAYLLLFFSCVTQAEENFELELLKLSEASYSEKSDIITTISRMSDERVLPVMQAILDARLYYLTQRQNMVYVNDVNGQSMATNVLNNKDLGLLESYENKKIRINNRLRRLLRSAISVFQLKNDNKDIRLTAAKALLKSPNKTLRPVLIKALNTEDSKKIKSVLNEAIAMIDINDTDELRRKSALGILGKSIEPEAVAVLTRLSEKDESGKYLDQNKELAESAYKQLKAVQSKLDLFKFLENIIFGMSLGSILLLAAIGLAITFGVMGVINMAHGEMIMLGAYTTFAIQQLFPQFIDASLFIAIPMAFLVAGCVGVLIERLVIRHLYGRPLDTLLATFGISLILQQAVRMYSSNNVAVITPEWMSGFWAINGAMSITFNRIYILIFSLIVLGLLALLLKKTMMGLQMRAVTQNRAMANSMGIRSGWVDALTFGLGSGIAGIAGVALSQITNVGPNLGQGYIIDSFMVVVFGGVGNLMGTFVGAMSLGIANKLLEPYAGAVVGKIIVLIFIILFIQWRPRGLFALKGRFVED